MKPATKTLPHRMSVTDVSERNPARNSNDAYAEPKTEGLLNFILREIESIDRAILADAVRGTINVIAQTWEHSVQDPTCESETCEEVSPAKPAMETQIRNALNNLKIKAQVIAANIQEIESRI